MYQGGRPACLQGLPSSPSSLEAVSLAGIFPTMVLEEAAGPAGRGAFLSCPALVLSVWSSFRALGDGAVPPVSLPTRCYVSPELPG